MNKNKKKNLIIIVLIILIVPAYFIYNSIMTSKIKNTRDLTRLTYISMIRSWVELYYANNAEYPKSLSDIEGKYISKIPVDPLDWQTINWCKFWYEYLVSNSVTADKKIMNNWAYTISNCFESKDNAFKAINDWWKDPLRYEKSSISY